MAEGTGATSDTTLPWKTLEEHAVDLSLEDRTEGDRTVVVVGGEIDVYTAPKLREKLIDLVSAGNYHLVVDMEAVEFLDSAGLGILVGGLKRARTSGGEIELVCTSRDVLRPLEITGLDRSFTIHRSREDALGGPA